MAKRCYDFRILHHDDTMLQILTDCYRHVLLIDRFSIIRTSRDQMDKTRKRVLDPCSGSRMMWFNKKNPDVIFGDKRNERHVLCDGRTLSIEPDMLMDFTALPFPDGLFKLVAFDPPHLKRAGDKSWLKAKYGLLGADWQEDLRKGFRECFRVLDNDGVLVFKWAEDQVKIKDVLSLTPVQPLFGHPTGRKGLTHWFVFMKPEVQ